MTICPICEYPDNYYFTVKEWPTAVKKHLAFFDLRMATCFVNLLKVCMNVQYTIFM